MEYRLDRSKLSKNDSFRKSLTALNSASDHRNSSPPLISHRNVMDFSSQKFSRKTNQMYRYDQTRPTKSLSSILIPEQIQKQSNNRENLALLPALIYRYNYNEWIPRASDYYFDSQFLSTSFVPVSNQSYGKIKRNKIDSKFKVKTERKFKSKTRSLFKAFQKEYYPHRNDNRLILPPSSKSVSPTINSDEVDLLDKLILFKNGNFNNRYTIDIDNNRYETQTVKVDLTD